MHLQHLHLSPSPPYRLVSTIQDILVRHKINHFHPKPASPTSPPSPLDDPAPPTLLTYVSQPTYTSGRRQTLSPSQISTLEHGSSSSSVQDATYVPSPRGGLLTFHGPGQLTAYPLIHLRSHSLTPRCYIRLLETSIIATLARYGVKGFTRDEYPGVWISPTQKLASIGVHVQRGVTCYGTGINVDVDWKWWRRFDACGIEGVEMVNLRDVGTDVDAVSAEAVGEALAESLAERLEGVEGVIDRPEEARTLYDIAVAREREGADGGDV